MKKLLHLLVYAAWAALMITACTSQPAAPPATSQIATPPPDNSPAAVVIEPGDHDRTLEFAGRTRAYILHIPLGYDGTKALPLVFVLHGYGDTASNIARSVGMNPLADKKNFIVVYPNGTGSPRQAWESGITPGLVEGADDVGYMRTLIEQLEAELRIDPKRIYAAGVSMGGMMTYRLGADLSDRLAGIAVVAGTVGAEQYDGSILTIPAAGGPIPVVAFHGKADPTIPYDGGPGDAGAGLSWLPVADSVAFSVRQNECTGSPEVTTSKDGNVITEAYLDCANGSEVLTYTIVSAAHEWPSLDGKAGFPASDKIWEFFARHPRPD